MSEWLDRYENHAIHNQLQSFEQLLDASEIIINEVGDSSAIESYERLRLIVNAVKLKFKSTDPLMFSKQSLDNLNTSFQPIINEVSNFNNNKNPGYLKNANGYVDNVLTALAGIVSPVLPEDVDGIKDSVASFRRSAGQYIRNLEIEFNGLKNRLESQAQYIEELTSEINAQKGRLDIAITQFQEQFSKTEDRRREQFEQEKDKRNADYEALVGDIEAKFNEDLTTLEARYQSLLEEIEKKEGQILEDAESYIQDIGKQKEQAAALVTIITNSGMAGGYQTVANKARTSSTFWQLVAVFSLVGLIVFAILTFMATLPDDFRLATIGARVFVAGTFGILAAYAARQAEKHEVAERKNRKMELELAAIDPYLSELPTENRHRIKEELAARLFAQNDTPETISSSKTSGTVVDLLHMALESVANLSKKSGS